MQEITLQVDTGLLIPGHGLSPTAAVESAEAWLRSRDVGEWAIHHARDGMRPQQAWWNDYRGFVGEMFDEGDCEPVTVIHLPASLITTIPRSDHAD